MPIPYLTTEQIAQVSVLTAQYITTQRERYAPAAASLSSQQKAAIAGFFLPQLLDTTRLLVLVGEPVANPDFYPMLRNLGLFHVCRNPQTLQKEIEYLARANTADTAKSEM